MLYIPKVERGERITHEPGTQTLERKKGNNRMMGKETPALERLSKPSSNWCVMEHRKMRALGQGRGAMTGI